MPKSGFDPKAFNLGRFFPTKFTAFFLTTFDPEKKKDKKEKITIAIENSKKYKNFESGPPSPAPLPRPLSSGPPNISLFFPLSHSPFSLLFSLEGSSRGSAKSSAPHPSLPHPSVVHPSSPPSSPPSLHAPHPVAPHPVGPNFGLPSFGHNNLGG